MSLNAVLSSGLSAILTSSEALRVTSNNIANANTPGYVRRVAQQETLAPGGMLAGVALSDVRRAVNAYFDREVLLSQATYSRYDVQSTIMDRLNVALGSPGDGSSLSSRLDALYAALGQASLDPAQLASRQGVLTQFQSMAQSISDLASSIDSLRQSADTELDGAVTTANSLISQIYEFNGYIRQAIVGGDTASGLLDQRDQAVRQLSELIGIRAIEQSNGSLFISTQDGTSLVGDFYVQLSHNPSGGSSYSPITFQTTDPASGQPIGPVRLFDEHSSDGAIRGLLDARDVTLAQIAEELGTFGQGLALAFNAQHNANSAVPPPTILDGRQTGLLATDSLGFTGAVTLGIADTNGILQQNIAIDFDAGTISVDGGPAAAIGTTIGSFVTALNTAMGGGGTASFTDGVLLLSATGTDGLVVTDDSANPSARGGSGFSHFFGLNDLFVSSGMTIPTTGLSGTDGHGLLPGGTFTLLLKGPSGERINETTVAVAGASIDDMLAAMNAAFTGSASFSLDADGRMVTTLAPAYQKYDLEVADDSTARGTTGKSFSQIFSLGTGETIAMAQNFRLTAALEDSPQLLAFALSSLTATTVAGTQIVGPGDNRGLLELQGLANRPVGFEPGGVFGGRTTTLGNYAANFYQDIARRGSTINANIAAQGTRLQQAELNQSKTEGVNLDEELARMIALQQAYSAGARIMRVADELMAELLNIV